jgi:hypothetical protein
VQAIIKKIKKQLTQREAFIVLLFGLIFGLYFLTPKVVETNQRSRYNLTHAIVFDGSIDIRKYMNNTIDWSGPPGGKFYTNKAPGMSFLGVPFLFVTSKVYRAVGGADPYPEHFYLRVNEIFTTMIPGVLLAFYLFLFVGKVNPTLPAATIAVTFALATIAFPVSTASLGHQTAGAFAFTSFYYLIISKKNNLLSGFLFSAAVLTEYSVALLFPAFFLMLIFPLKRSNFKKTISFALGGIPLLIVFCGYHKLAFGGYFTLPMKFNNPLFLEDSSRNMFYNVVGIPSPTIFYELLFGLKRGLFVISPVLLLATIGLFRGLFIKNGRKTAIFCLWAFGSFLLFNASFNGWHAGSFSGPRYLAPSLPFLIYGLVYFRPHFIFFLFLIISVLNISAIMTVTIFARPEINLLTEAIYPRLLAQINDWPVFILIVLTSFFCLYLASAKIDKIKNPSVDQDQIDSVRNCYIEHPPHFVQ